MEYFQVEFSKTAERLDLAALTEEEKNSLFTGIVHDPQKHDVYRVLIAVTEREPDPSWKPRHEKRKKFELVDRVLLDIRPSSKDVHIAGVYPETIAADGQSMMDLEVQAGAKILDVGKASLRFAGPIKNWWRKRRPLVVSNRTDRLAQWVYSREWLDAGRQCLAEILCVVPKELPEIQRSMSCYVDFKEKEGRAIERARSLVLLPSKDAAAVLDV